MTDYRKYTDYIIEQAEKLLSIDSPSGYCRQVTDYLLEEFSDRIRDLFIWRISLMEDTFYTKIPLAASAKLMEQLFQYYQTPQDFQQILNEVYSHQEAAKILSELPEYQEETLEKAKQLLNQDFLFEEDQE